MPTETDPAPPELRLYTVDEVCKVLHCGDDYLRGLVRDRVVPCTKIGKRLLFSEAHLKDVVRHFERPAVVRR